MLQWAPAGAAPVYATLLTPKGKFLHDLIFYQAPSSSSQGGKEMHMQSFCKKQLVHICPGALITTMQSGHECLRPPLLDLQMQAHQGPAFSWRLTRGASRTRLHG